MRIREQNGHLKAAQQEEASYYISAFTTKLSMAMSDCALVPDPTNRSELI